MCPTNLWSSIARIAATLAPWHAESTPFLSASNSLDPNASEDLDIRTIDQAPTITAPTPAGWTHEQAYLIERLERERKGGVAVEVALAYVEDEGKKTETFLQGLETVACTECGEETRCAIYLEGFGGEMGRIVRLPCHREHVFHEARVRRLLIGTTRCPLDRQVWIERGARPSMPQFSVRGGVMRRWRIGGRRLIGMRKGI